NALVKALNLQIINFASGSSDIPADNKAILDQAATLLNKVTGVKLDVGGHTDSTGNAAANKALSQRRAQAVVDYLVS
ncbi:OmpA family protein, partial [Klebsiella pneumoniae]|nr:OmpA family protein [Klebsiella pneumoniae]